MAVVHTNKAPLTAVSVVSSGAAVTNNNNALSATQDPIGSAGYGNGYTRGRYVFSGTFASTPAANAAVTLYPRFSTDGGTSTFETDLGRSTRPVRSSLAFIPLDSTNTTQTRQSEEVDLPGIPHQVIVMNDGAGSQLNSTWSLTVIPSTDQGV